MISTATSKASSHAQPRPSRSRRPSAKRSGRPLGCSVVMTHPTRPLQTSSGNPGLDGGHKGTDVGALDRQREAEREQFLDTHWPKQSHGQQVLPRIPLNREN